MQICGILCIPLPTNKFRKTTAYYLNTMSKLKNSIAVLQDAPERAPVSLA